MNEMHIYVTSRKEFFSIGFYNKIGSLIRVMCILNLNFPHKKNRMRALMLLVWLKWLEGQLINLDLIELYPIVKSISMTTSYEMNILLPQTLNVNNKITLDFSKTNIIIADGILSECVYEDILDKSIQFNFNGSVGSSR
jgi:hypothetical protein